MKREAVFGYAIAATLSTVIASNPAYADECQSAASYIRMSNGKCHSLTYFHLRDLSRQDLKTAQGLYKDALRLNTSEQTTLLSKEEQYARLKVLDAATINLKDSSTTNDQIERWAFRKNLRVLNSISGQLAPWY